MKWIWVMVLVPGMDLDASTVMLRGGEFNKSFQYFGIGFHGLSQGLSQ
jgi:hypothetical protein